ncbi:uncharacterized protein [Watersipora subatra]|uniref:uncharacterized protein n=1 Tax=Watersipora subatra TaxID=2589382 RepID=UPI00355B4723
MAQQTETTNNKSPTPTHNSISGQEEALPSSPHMSERRPEEGSHSIENKSGSQQGKTPPSSAHRSVSRHEEQPVQRSASARTLRSAEIRSSLSKSGSEGELKDLASQPKRASAPNSARSDMLKRKPLPPITAGEERKEEGKDEFASITESELGDGDVHQISSDDEGEKEKVEPVAKGSEVETQTEWSWIETMKAIQKGQQLSQNAGGRGSVGSKASRTSKTGTLVSQSSRRQSTLLKDKPTELFEPESSITGTVEEGPPEVMTTLVLPYRDDEYGVPVLQFSESDTDSETETTASKPKTNKTLPSIGPPQILQYKRDINKPVEDESKQEKEAVNEEEAETELMNIETVNELITFTGNCEFCNNAIKPFPTLHQQQILSPQELYCCEEFANFVRLAILPPPPNAHLIDVKPHAHYGSKQARAAAREKAQARIREREVQRAQQAHHSAHTGSGTGTTSGPGTTGGGAPSGAGGGPGGVAGGGGGGGGGGMFAYARAMKTINFQLSSQRCIDEGYVIRPPSPLLDEEYVAKPFEIEPLDWNSVDQDGQPIDFEDDEALFTPRDKPQRRRKCVERFYPNEQKFLTMFPDGTGSVFYPNGQLAISVSSIEPGQFTYLIYDTQSDETSEQMLLAEFEPDAVGTCYHRSTGNVRLFVDQLGGLEAHPDGSRKRRWHWLDQTTHMHAPPVQPLCFALNKHIGVRVLNQDNISMTFLSYQRSCRFNVGVKLKLVHPENLPPDVLYDEDKIFMDEKANRVSGLLSKIDNLLKYPNSTRADKIRAPKRVTIKSEKIEKYKKQSQLAQEKERMRRSKKSSRPLPPLNHSDLDPVLMTETEVPTPHKAGRPPKYPTVVVN